MMKSNRKLLVFDRLDMRVGFGEFVHSAIPIASIKEINPSEPGIVQPWIEVRAKVVMNDESVYYSKQPFEELIAQIEQGPVHA